MINQNLTQANISHPPGLVGDIAQFIMGQSPYPNADIALAASIGFLSGITGKAFNTYTGAGINQYILVLAVTGMGKEAMASGIHKLVNAIRPNIRDVDTFIGPGHIASAPALIKWLVNSPSIISIIGEFGLKFKAMSSPKASPNDLTLKALLLELYPKSAKGSIFAQMAYSDASKNTDPIISPSLCLLCESVPEVFYEALNEGSIASGLLPRFATFNISGKRPYLNTNIKAEPDTRLTQTLADLCGYCLSLNQRNEAITVPFDVAAQSLANDFERWITDEINKANSEAHRQLWNRAYLKATKLASLIAVGRNYLAPMVTFDDFIWASNLIADQTNNLIAKFANDEIGEIAGNENQQVNEVIRAIGIYCDSKWPELPCKDAVTELMHERMVVSQTWISRYVLKRAAFKVKDPSLALKKCLDILLNSDELAEMSKVQMQQTFGRSPRSFCPKIPDRFVQAALRARA